MRSAFRSVIAPSLVIAAALAACDTGASEVGVARFALTSDAAFFRLRIFKTAPSSLDAKNLFDTGCLQQQSRTYELSNIPLGEGYTVVYEGFSAFGCNASEAVSLGYRGGVAITAGGELPYYHVQVYPKGDTATLPEEINLSASVARAVDFCEQASDCGASEVCYDAAKPEYWCVPSCTADTDCRSIHVRANCDIEAGWCTLRSPFPLNLSEPRAFGAAATLSDGDVLLLGGFRQDGVGLLLPTMYPLERFDAQSGLFVAAAVGGNAPAIGGDFGFASLGPDRFVTIGGFVRAHLDWSDAGLALTTESAGVSADVTIWDLAAGQARSTPLSRSVARPAVARIAADRFFVAGGLVVSGPGLEATRSTSLCTVSEGAPVCEPGPMLQHPRQGAAAACLDAACNRILVLGGNPGGDLAEVVDVGANTSTGLQTSGLGDKLFGPVLCGLDLIAGSTVLARSMSFQPMRLTLGEGSLTATPIAGAPMTTYLPSVSGTDATFGATPECYLGGGLAGSELTQTTTGRIARSDGNGALSGLGPVLGRPRFGAVAARIGGGVLAGRILFAGGMALDGNGPVRVVRGAEVLTP